MILRLKILLFQLFALLVVDGWVFGQELRVEFTNLKSDKAGQIMLSVYDSENSFLKESGIVEYTIAQVTPGKSTTLVFKDLKPGTYAFAVYHDANKNKTLDKNFLGIPTEGYGFSNNAEATFGPPSYTAARFTVPTKGTVVQKIQLNY